MQNKNHVCVCETRAYIACRSGLQTKLQFTTTVLNKTSNDYVAICGTYVSFSVHFLNFLSLDLFLPTHCSCKRLFLHLNTLNYTRIVNRTRLETSTGQHSHEPNIHVPTNPSKPATDYLV